uniref:Uncharacterized protein n=1 Tax=Euplotes harpa TaxID=151035 RepID=A0A7S3J0L9_9SPIT
MYFPHTFSMSAKSKFRSSKVAVRKSCKFQNGFLLAPSKRLSDGTFVSIWPPVANSSVSSRMEKTVDRPRQNDASSSSFSESSELLCKFWIVASFGNFLISLLPRPGLSSYSFRLQSSKLSLRDDSRLNWGNSSSRSSLVLLILARSSFAFSRMKAWLHLSHTVL